MARFQKSNIDDFWLKMIGIYGLKWRDNYGEYDASGVWLNSLSRFSVKQVLKAIADSVREYPSRPPTLAQFSSLCKAAPDLDQPPALEAPDEHEMSRTEQKEWLESIRLIAAKTATAYGRSLRTMENGQWNDEDERRYQNHLKILELDEESRHKKTKQAVQPGSFSACCVANCINVGALSHSVSGSSQWYCRKHFSGL